MKLKPIGYKPCFTFLLLILVDIAFSDDDIKGEQAISCGSAVKLRHVESSIYYLNSLEMAWGTGSGQQIVTLGKTKNSSSALWQVREANGNPVCATGQSIRCGDIIRLMHIPTKKNLHTHGVNSMLSINEQEVSAFGDEKGEGDDSDDWRVVCSSTSSNEVWKRNRAIKLQHVATRKYLSSSKKRKFTQSNCPNCPIVNHLEVTGASRYGEGSLFRAEQGVFIFNE